MEVAAVFVLCLASSECYRFHLVLTLGGMVGSHGKSDLRMVTDGMRKLVRGYVQETLLYQ